MKVIISFVASVVFGGGTAVLILSLRQYVPNGYTTRVEFALVAGLLICLSALSLLLNALQAIEHLKQIKRNLFGRDGKPFFVVSAELPELVKEIIREQKLDDDLKAAREQNATEHFYMERLESMQRDLAENGFSRFGNADKQKEYEELTAKYGEKLEAEKAKLNAPTTTVNPVRAFDPNRISPARPPSA